jgi:tetratricopeptide (TPR) repeat protein
MRTSPRRAAVKSDDGALAGQIGRRLKAARLRAGLTQQQLAGTRYTKAYVSALENGLVRPSMVALTFFASQLDLPPARLITDEAPAWSRLEADIHLAAGRWQEAVDAYSALLETATQTTNRAELLNGRAEAFTRLDNGPSAASDASEAAQIFGQAGRAADAVLAQYWLAFAQYQQENASEARALLQSILAKIRAGLIVEPDFSVRVLMALSSVESREGEHGTALAYLEEVRGLADSLDDRRRASFFQDLAYSYRATGDFEAAIRHGYASLALFRARGAEIEVGSLENDLALTYLHLGNLPRAAELSAASRKHFVDLKDERWLAHVEDTAAQVALAEGRFEAALELTGRSIETAERTGNRKALTGALMTRAKANVELDRLDDAVACYERAATIARASGPRGWLREILGQWAELMAKLGQHERAYELTREALGAT